MSMPALLVLLLLAAGLPHPGRVKATAPPHEGQAACTFEGLDVDGAPAEAVVVVSSAGGAAVTRPDGTHALRVALPSTVESVHVTTVASGAGGRASSARVTTLGRSGTLAVPPLLLGAGGPCEPDWLPAFGDRPGAGIRMSALAVFDDGDGPALYAGGVFDQAGSVVTRAIVRWNGDRWTGLRGSPPATSTTTS